jgi:hypothetical protein
MADAEIRAESAQVTLTSSLSPNSPSEPRSESSGIIPLSDMPGRAGALSRLSPAMQRAVENFAEARDFLCSLPIDCDCAENDRAEAAYLAADCKLLETPAENLHDLRAKFDTVWDDTSATPNEITLLAFFADFRRLTGDTVSTVFNPSRWLHYFEMRGGAYVVRGDEVFLLEPADADLAGNLFELEALGGKPAVDALIRQRCAQEVSHG